MGWEMMSEYILGDNFEKGGDGGYSSSGGPGGGCLVLFAVLGSVLIAGLGGLVLVVSAVAIPLP